MKKSFFLWSLLVVAVMSISSCSSNADSLLELVPADADYVMVGDINTVVESAGGSIKKSQVKLPSWFKSVDQMADGEISEGVNTFNDYLKRSGVNTDAIACVGSFRKEYVILIGKLDDSKKFVKMLKNEIDFDDEDEEDGVEYFITRKFCVGIDGSTAYVFLDDSWSRDNNGKRIISSLIDEAKESPFSKTSMAKFISGSTFGMSVQMPREFRQAMREQGVPSDISALYSGYVCFKGTLDNDDVEIEAKLFDEEGKEHNVKDFKDMMDFGAKVNSNALAYLGKNESFVVATCLKDVKWSKYLDAFASAARMSDYDRRELGVVEDYLKNIDGTVAAGFGFKNGLESVAALNYGHDVLSAVDFTLVIETKNGKAEKVMRDLAGLMDQARVPYDGSASKGFSIDIPDAGGSVYIATNSNFIIMSNHKIQKSKENPTVKAFDFDDYICSFAGYLDKNNKLMKDLGIKNSLLLTYAYDAPEMEMKMKLEVKDGKGSGVLEKIGNMLISASKTDFSQYSPYRSSAYDYDRYEEVVPAEVYEEVIDSVCY